MGAPMTVAYQILASDVDLISLPVNISNTLGLCLSVHQAAQSTVHMLHSMTTAEVCFDCLMSLISYIALQQVICLITC